MPEHVFHDICTHIVWHTNNDQRPEMTFPAGRTRSRQGLVRMAEAPDPAEAGLKPA